MLLFDMTAFLGQSSVYMYSTLHFYICTQHLVNRWRICMERTSIQESVMAGTTVYNSPVWKLEEFPRGSLLSAASEVVDIMW